MSGRGPYIVAVVFPLIAPSALAQSLCVECQAPDRSYSCSIKDSDKIQAVRGGQRAQEYLCISELARIGGHQACRITTSYAGPCMGQTFEIDIAKIGSDSVVIGRPPAEGGTGAGPGAVPGPEQKGEPGGGQLPKATPVKKGPPQTLEELARETVAKSKEQIGAADQSVKKAGDAVGGAFKKTWDCMTSLFQRC